MNLKQTLVITAALLVGTPVFAGTPERSEIDKVFADYDSTRSPGCSMAIYHDGEIAYARGYGMANLEYGIANGPNTVFRIGSTSKQFTAMAVALLAEQGKLSLDDDIHKFFPALPGYGEPVTVRQLLHHTSGLRDYLELTWLADWREDYSVDEALNMILRQRELNFPPGTDHLYSNSGYFLLSQIVQKVTDQTLRVWADENMFRPLGMTNTHFHDDHTHIVENRADGYDSADNDGFRISMTTLEMVGDGGVYTTVEDLLKWDRNFYDNRLGKGEPGLIELMQTPGKLKNGDVLDYAFGLSVDEFAGTREISHGGAFVGYRAELSRYPDHRLSVVVLCNYANTDPSSLARRVASLYLGGKVKNGGLSGLVLSQSREPREIIELSASALGRFAGDYWNPDRFMLRSIVVDDNSLFYDRGSDNRSRLDPVGDDHFLMADVPVAVVVRFEPRGETPQTMVVEVKDREPVHLERFERAAPGTGELLAYTGSFYSSELDHEQVFSIDEGVIVAERRGGKEPLQPLQPDSFITGDGVVLNFERNPDGKVSGFRLQAGRVRNVRYIRQ